MKKLLLALYLFSSGLLAAQASSTDKGWYPGLVVLQSVETVHGQVQYDHHIEVVQCKSGEVTRAFTAAQVKYFRFQDADSPTDRKFVPLVYNPKSLYPRTAFFEVVSKGEFTVLRRHSSWKHLTGNPKFMQVPDGLGFSNTIIGFDYFLQQGNEVQRIKNFRKELFPKMMQEYDEEISQFVKANHLKLFTLAGQIIVIQYYNFLKDPLKNRWDLDNASATTKPTGF